MKQENINMIERHVLGTILMQPDLLASAITTIRPDTFSIIENRKIYDSLVNVYQSGLDVDIISIANESKYDIEYIAQLLNEVNPDFELSTACMVLNEFSQIQALSNLSAEIQAKIKSMDPLDICQWLSGEIVRIGTNQDVKYLSFSENIEEFRKFINDRISGEISGTKTGIKLFDMFSGGLQTSDLIIIAAETSQGKTSLALNIIANIVKINIPVLFISLEMGKMQIVGRIVSSESELSFKKMSTGGCSDIELHQVEAHMERIKDKPLFIAESRSSKLSDICNLIRIHRAKFGIPGAVIDYLQLISGEKTKREEEVGHIARTLKNIAKELNIWIIALSQLRRPTAGQTHYPTLSRLRDSGQIEEAADIIMFINRPEAYPGNESKEDITFDDGSNATGMAEIIIAKGRNIGTTKFKMRFFNNITKFTNYHEEENTDFIYDGGSF
ncbi:MAG: DnaB-like helicase C-terminal domain-containing protein [Mariniphaga sp.]|nr:DnaB-like helicase C-terminal domain-containing protein [Paludibacter sp.]MDD4225979.1 DnaB-like helicase C-terminal domain-containing protein [Mariniphaga sp.]